jgi:HPt (histidine-containing phosphotransfer) domain-containing protein
MKFFKPVAWQKEDVSLREKADNELRQNLINNFVKSNRTKHEEIFNALEAGDIELAHRLAHSLKNNAAQLKQIALQKAAEEIESLLHDGANNTTARHLEVLSSELRATLAELELLVREPSRTSDKAPLEFEIAVALLEKLEPLLANFNTECLVLVDDLRMIPGSEELIRNMENIDFVLSQKSLSDLKDSLKTRYNL